MDYLPEELLARLLSDPDDTQTYLVCADWLQTRGDPRGELIVVQHRQLAQPDDPTLRAAQSELIRAHSRSLLGGAAEHLPTFCFGWHMGFIRRLRMFGIARDPFGRSLPTSSLSGEQTAENVLAELLQHPSTVLLRSLTLGPYSWGNETRGSAQDMVDALSEMQLPEPLQELFLFDDIDGAIKEPCEVSKLCEAVAGLESLSLHGRHVLLGQSRLPRLKRLSLGRGENFESTLASELPELEELAVWCPSSGIEHTLVAAVLDGHFPKLHALRLRNFRDADALCRALANTPVAAGLQVLELSMTTLSAYALDALRGSRSLQVLDLLGSQLDEAAERALSDFARGTVRWTRPRHPQANLYIDFSTPATSGRSFLGLRGEELSAGDPARARDAHEILRLCAGAGRSLYDAGTRLLLEGKIEQGLPMLHAALEMPDSGFYRSTFSNVGVAHERLGDFDVAEEIARRAIEVFGSDPNHWAILIDVLHRQGKMDEALQALAEGQRYIDGSNNGMALLETCMMTWLVHHRPEKARVLYEDFVAAGHTPREQARGHAALAYVHLDDLPSARALLRELTKSDLPVVHHARACVRVLSKRRRQAAESMERARRKTYPGLALLDDDPILKSIQVDG